MVVRRLRLRDFRTYAAAEVALGERLTVVHGPNGAGKTNLLEALYFGCTGRSCRTSNEREVVRFDAQAARVEVAGFDRDGEHELAVGFEPGETKRFKVDGAPVERLIDAPSRPLVSVFLPDRLELVKGPPGAAPLAPRRRSSPRSGRRARRPAARYGQRARPAQRAARARPRRRRRASSLAAWDLELARHGIALRDDRARAVALLDAPLRGASPASSASRATPELRYRPRTKAADAEELAAELAERLDADLAARLHRPRPAPRRPRAAARRARAARLRVPGRAAHRPAGPAARRARGARRGARRAAAAAARRRHERARRRRAAALLVERLGATARRC